MSRKLHPVRKPLVTPRRGLVPRPLLEHLEERCLLSASPFYSVDGSGNNLSDPSRYNWGAVGQDLLRVAPAQYGGDGSGSVMAGAGRPGARLISTTIAGDTTDGNLPNDRFMSDWVYAWGQFIDHDMDLTTNGTGPQLQPANIPVPTGDPYFDPNSTGTQVIGFNRSEYDPNTGTSPSNPRQQVNNITSFIDGSQVYGSSQLFADALRTHQGGTLKSSPGPDGVTGTRDDLLPLNNQTNFPGLHESGGDGTGALPMGNDAHLVPDSQLFAAGDVRANENIELTAVQTLFMREHNRIAGVIAASPDFAGKDLSDPAVDEAIYQSARAIVIGEIQSITYNEFLPALLGGGVISVYQGYNPSVSPGITTEFSTAGFRLGHSLLAPDVEFLNPDASTAFPTVSLAGSFSNPGLVQQNGADPILKYLGTDNAQEIDNKLVPELQNFLFGPPGSGGFDLAALNIQRGRDHGLADYNTTRIAYGLPAVTTFSQITSNKSVQQELKKLYGNVNNIDLWVGMLAEDHVAGGSVGPLVQAIVKQQFENVRNGDRLWFENLYSGADLAAFENTSLAQVISRNTVNDAAHLQPDVFFFKVQISGVLFNDANNNGAQDSGEAGLQGRVIQLLDHGTGAVVAYTLTAADGSYSFDNLSADMEPGVAYDVRWVLKAQQVQTTPNPPTITFTRGETVSGVNFGSGTKKSGSGTLTSVVYSPASGAGPLDDAAIVDIVRLLQSKQ